MRPTDRAGGQLTAGGHPATDRHLDLRDTAIEAVRAAGGILRRYAGDQLNIDVESAHDLKLEIDRRCEQAMVALIQKRFPDHGIVAEEGGTINPGADYRWYLDPLDGTVNYFLQQPYYGTCAACYYHPPTDHRGRIDPWTHPLVGVVYAPALGQCFEARPGKPARCNGHVIRPGGECRLRQSVIGFSFGSDPGTMQRMRALVAALVPRARKVRIFGATGLDLVNVACGRLSGLVQGHVRGWDFAAARVILQAAGGYFNAVARGGDAWQIVGAAPGIATDLQVLVDRYAA